MPTYCFKFKTKNLYILTIKKYIYKQIQYSMLVFVSVMTYQGSRESYTPISNNIDVKKNIYIY